MVCWQLEALAALGFERDEQHLPRQQGRRASADMFGPCSNCLRVARDCAYTGKAWFPRRAEDQASVLEGLEGWTWGEAGQREADACP